ncbi:hypothetical protein B0H16DRAFT_1463335 [Mycena metata]|uniref:Uncharacterized protein n=1 Tax=Mycena metata TaxID=1033252 RepID=A0AAD7N3L0_9AGAR|nr:hypothetical protein B0H16DRAFT_1463335 [Mycena metata]
MTLGRRREGGGFGFTFHASGTGADRVRIQGWVPAALKPHSDYNLKDEPALDPERVGGLKVTVITDGLYLREACYFNFILFQPKFTFIHSNYIITSSLFNTNYYTHTLLELHYFTLLYFGGKKRKTVRGGGVVVVGRRVRAEAWMEASRSESEDVESGSKAGLKNYALEHALWNTSPSPSSSPSASSPSSLPYSSSSSEYPLSESESSSEYSLLPLSSSHDAPEPEPPRKGNGVREREYGPKGEDRGDSKSNQSTLPGERKGKGELGRRLGGVRGSTPCASRSSSISAGVNTGRDTVRMDAARKSEGKGEGEAGREETPTRIDPARDKGESEVGVNTGTAGNASNRLFRVRVDLTERRERALEGGVGVLGREGRGGKGGRGHEGTGLAGGRASVRARRRDRGGWCATNTSGEGAGDVPGLLLLQADHRDSDTVLRVPVSGVVGQDESEEEAHWEDEVLGEDAAEEEDEEGETSASPSDATCRCRCAYTGERARARCASCAAFEDEEAVEARRLDAEARLRRLDAVTDRRSSGRRYQYSGLFARAGSVAASRRVIGAADADAERESEEEAEWCATNANAEDARFLSFVKRVRTRTLRREGVMLAVVDSDSRAGRGREKSDGEVGSGRSGSGSGDASAAETRSPNSSSEKGGARVSTCMVVVVGGRKESGN